jgi:hypothetical protein
VGIGFFSPFQSHPRQQLFGLYLGLCWIHALDSGGSHSQVSDHVHVIEQIELLEHHPDFLAVFIDVHTFPQQIHTVENQFARSRLLQQVQAPQES